MATAGLEAGESGSPDLLVAAARRALVSSDLALAERLAAAAADAGGGVAAAHVLALSLLVQRKDAEDVLAGLDQIGPDEKERAVTAELRALGLLWVGKGRPTEAETVLAGLLHRL